MAVALQNEVSETTYSVCRCTALNGTVRDVPIIVWTKQMPYKLAGLTQNGELLTKSKGQFGSCIFVREVLQKYGRLYFMLGQGRGSL